MKKPILFNLVFLLLASFFIASCGDDDSEDPSPTSTTDNGSNDAIDINDLSRGQGVAKTTGPLSLDLEGSIVSVTTNATINDKDYFFITITITESGESSAVALSILIPSSENRMIPNNGEITIASQLDALDETYSYVSVFGENASFVNNSLSTGTVTVSNADVDNNSFDVVFDFQGLSSFDTEETLTLTGAARY